MLAEVHIILVMLLINSCNKTPVANREKRKLQAKTCKNIQILIENLTHFIQTINK